MDRPKLRADTNEVIGSRIRVLRQALGYVNASEFARLLEWTPQRLAAYESGRNSIKNEVAHAIEVATEARVEWLFRGDDSRMPYGLMTKIKAVLAQAEEQPRSNRGRPKSLAK